MERLASSYLLKYKGFYYGIRQAAYLVDLNATQAAIRAGYSKKTANEQAARLLAKVSVQEAVRAAQAKRLLRNVEVAKDLSKPDISAAIREAQEARSARTGITQDRVLEELADSRKTIYSRNK